MKVLKNTFSFGLLLKIFSRHLYYAVFLSSFLLLPIQVFAATYYVDLFDDKEQLRVNIGGELIQRVILS